jgi:hypothetical protein
MNGHVRETHEHCNLNTCVICDLYCCKVCGCAEGSLLPVCPDRRVSMEEQDAYYKHYCAGTGPFARATRDTVDVAKAACLDRLQLRRISSGRLYDAVSDLWNFVHSQ